MSYRGIERIVDSFTTREGAGFLVHRPFPTHDLSMIDPFLLLDEMGPFDAEPGKAKGAISRTSQARISPRSTNRCVSTGATAKPSRFNSAKLRPAPAMPNSRTSETKSGTIIRTDAMLMYRGIHARPAESWSAYGIPPRTFSRKPRARNDRAKNEASAAASERVQRRTTSNEKKINTPAMGATHAVTHVEAR